MSPVLAIIDEIGRHIRLSPDSTSALLSVLTYKEVARKEHIVPMHAVHEHISFIHSGCVREYYLTDQSEEVVVWFGFERDIAVSLPSFVLQQPARTAIQALEPTTILQVSRTDLYNLYDQFHDLERLGRLLAEENLIKTDFHIHCLQALTAKQRYEAVLAQYPQLGQRVPLSMIASYLGITKETLSRIRAKPGNSSS
ncbi:Crp/Fnr family transcriptional regulator [Spirosoma panaciterrae]|uniref:Crp/Fnr family transcriptional regulator n=1 Tax=Spirosoma panaciterrae TaxID=496058 RepID=UPI00036B3AB5|nr:Crp/Fnr family transcriptional regulator [Spirosoma panaciterrae]